jgi:hypothetical protein
MQELHQSMTATVACGAARNAVSFSTYDNPATSHDRPKDTRKLMKTTDDHLESLAQAILAVSDTQSAIVNALNNLLTDPIPQRIDVIASLKERQEQAAKVVRAIWE